VARLCLLACTAATTADQIGWAAPQLAAIRGDPGWHGGDYHDAPPGHGPHRGLGVARRIAHLSYRSAFELGERFGRRAQDDEDPWRGGRYAVESYLDHHARKLVRRFDALSYVRLTELMNAHDVGRDRGGTAAGLARVTARTLVAGVSSDRLYPLEQQAELVAGIPRAGQLRMVDSPYGHDGFLIEAAAVGALVTELLDR
jgi:homoserine O-acetyltransferase/O-succinyltransferase